MLGKPLFSIDDFVSFIYEGETKYGIIYVVDAMGTFFNHDDCYYDIIVDSENTLYKHIKESDIKPLNPNDVD